MPGPPKKDPSLVVRRNKPPAKTVLKGKVSRIPALPTGTRWYPQVREWWKRQWSSPMAAMWDESDRDAMFVAAMLLQQFWDPETKGSTRNQTAAQIRAVTDQLGLSPMARNRLGWELPDPDAGKSETSAATVRKAPVKKAAAKDADPRKRRLQVVS